MTNKLAAIAITHWLVTIAEFGFFFLRGWTSVRNVGRAAIHLAPSERVQGLG